MPRKSLSRPEEYLLINLMKDPEKGYTAKNLFDKEYAEFASKELGIDANLHHIHSLRHAFNIPAGSPKRVMKEDEIKATLRELDAAVETVENKLDAHSIRLDDCIRELNGLKKEVAEMARNFRLNRMNEHDHSKRPGASQ